ncbi:TRAP-type C4-dicarboxylate transport system, periplasmic component [Sphaerochaeta pleomorpha str. Grapes]|uniref:TRAP-type C4-dicarboxylate transport system, periplasmic component n=1 Tax=Sphaerochaeta pleomorpha (strain ATCC BAA-1885 / DSM 22778 / Grapes) TaxID=158190 RepID=G8QSS7_SPHPG|nr:TRAP transporter substrate-binding protein DctP [Sphaerochaeta pleomorpha]AEV30109.1 TRAP-type C4-dicarboxylate transport system, periplasmic component [Sphaerochaeta pleomorpha str. Grapes]
MLKSSCSQKSSSPHIRKTLFKYSFLVATCLLLPLTSLFSAELPIIRISVENTASHVQTQAVEKFAKALQQNLAGTYEIQFFPAASLFKDSDIFGALSQGKVEIAVPGTWQFDRYIPEVGLFLLPSLYGKKAITTYNLMQSPLGEKIITAIENSMDVKILGRWIDLGYIQVFSTEKPIRNQKDYIGKLIRVAGGKGNVFRLETLGAKAVSIAWTDLPLALSRSKVDGILTSYESVASARLWEYGIKQVYEDNQYFAQYVPIISAPFWSRLPKEVQQTLLTTWDSIVDQERFDAKYAQAIAKEKIRAKNIAIKVPPEKEIQETRDRLLLTEKETATKLGIPTETYALLKQFFLEQETL